MAVPILLFFLPRLFAGSVTGQVEDPVGMPVAGVRLFLFNESESLVSKATTDQQGWYRFQSVKPGNYSIFVRESGFARQTIAVQLQSDEEVQNDIILKLEPLQQDLVVTATRTETPSSLLGSSVTEISESEIGARRSLSVAELLRSVPTVNVSQVGGRGNLTSLFMRGGDSDYTKVLVDGMPLNQPGGAVDLSHLSITNIEKVEIVRGAQSALYGSDAITGVVQIFTKKGDLEKRRPEIGLTVEGGSYNSLRAGAGLSGGVGLLTYSAQFQHFETDNRVPNDDFHNSSFSSRLDFETSQNSSLALVARVERGRTGVPGPTAFGPADLDAYYQKRDFLAGLRWTQRVSDTWSQHASYSQSYVNQLSENPIASPPFIPSYKGHVAAIPYYDFPYSSLNATRRHDLSYQGDFVLSTHLLSAGLDFEEECGTIGEIRASRTNLGYYLQDQYIWRQRLSFTGGLRFEDNGSYGFAAVPRLSVAYLLRRGSSSDWFGMTRPKTSFGSGIREPNFIESFSQNPYFKGNPNLTPEKTRSFEAGVEQEILRDKIRAEVNFFSNRFNDLIVYQVTDYLTYEGSYFNLAKSQASGVENIVEAMAGPHLRISAGYTYLNSKVVQSANSFDPVYREGVRLLLRPTHSGYLGLNWTTSRWFLNAAAVFVGNRAASDFVGLGLTEVSGYTKLDLTGSYQISAKVDFYTVLENFLNQEYFEALGYPALKFNFRSGLRLKF
jgi:outer membrane cobalamin receptor